MNNEIFDKLGKSKFRSKFHLTEKDKEYIINKGIDEIEKHAKEFIKKRLVPKYIKNDGKQTPYKGHPVFIAQHATATCCRSCLYKWHKFSKNIELDEKQQKYIINLIMIWIEKEMKKSL